MRALRSLGLGWVLSLGLISAYAVVFSATPAAAQFDDEFDDEFGDEPEAEPEPEPEPEAPAPADEDPFGDDFGDDFDDEDAGGDVAVEEDLEADTEVEEEEEQGEAETERERLFRAQNTYLGPVGGLHVVDAASGAVGTFRVQLATDFFFTNDFIVPDDDADHIGGSLSISWTVHEMIELFASVQSYANSNDMEDPSLFQVLGDTHLGLKAFYRALPWLAVGGDLDLALLNTVGDIGLVFKSTSFGIRGNLTADLRGLSNPIPFIARLNLQYFFDNSSKLIDDVEQARFDSLPDPATPGGVCDTGEECEHRHLLTPVERFGLGINRTDFFNIALGFEAPLQVADDFYLQPLVEWVWNIPVNRQGYDCLYRPDEVALGADDGCLAEQGVSSFPMNLTLGTRVLPPVEGLSFLLAADIGLTGKKKGDFVRELAPNAPYNLYLGLAYAYDTVEPPAPEPEIREVERRVEVPAELPLEGRIRGTIVEQGAGTPVAGATIRFPNHDKTALVAGEDGTFTTYRFPPGEVLMDLTHEEYNPGQCAATIPDAMPEGQEELIVEVQCELVALPRVGGIAGMVVGADGNPVTGASVELSGPASRTVNTGPDGRFTLTDLPPGTYQVKVDADDFLIRTDSVEVVPRENAEPRIQLVERPRRALVRVRNRSIQIRRKINFATNSAEILPSSEPLLLEIADVIIRNPDITKIEIQGHTDNRGSDARNTELSQQRAESVRTWLIGNGIDGTRLVAKGYGPSRPLVPNITPANRARNRRVQFVIEERVEAPAE